VPGYPFPWTTGRFYSVMPDCVLGVTGKLAPFTLKETAYDLIVLGIPGVVFVPQHPGKQPYCRIRRSGKLLIDTPVVTITGARNMWLNTFVEHKDADPRSGRPAGRQYRVGRPASEPYQLLLPSCIG
jgi:hypothetical protein